MRPFLGGFFFVQKATNYCFILKEAKRVLADLDVNNTVSRSPSNYRVVNVQSNRKHCAANKPDNYQLIFALSKSMESTVNYHLVN